ncbi:MAG: hypothetical protein E7403_04420 [Ruminococcaceae bacterium]|nr:hypothetical protein [Oscillospiraceae bacterium]
MKMLRKEKSYENIGEGIQGMKIAIVALLFLSILATCGGLYTFKKFLNYKDTLVPVQATVSKIIKEVDDDGDTDYEVYVNYEYNGVKVENKKFKTFDSRILSVGDSVKISISSVNPHYIFLDDTGYFLFFIAAVILSVAVCISTELLHKLPSKNSDENLITDEMVANDLKPDLMVYPAKILLFLGAVLVFGHVMLSDLFRTTSLSVGEMLVFIGVVLFILSLNSVKKMPSRKYTLNVHTCTKKWSEGSGEDEERFTKFSGMDKISGYYGVVGEKYYLVRTHKGKFCQLYSVSFWHPAIEDETLLAGSRKIIKNLILDAGITIVAVVLYVGILYGVAFYC